MKVTNYIYSSATFKCSVEAHTLSFSFQCYFILHYITVENIVLFIPLSLLFDFITFQHNVILKMNPVVSKLTDMVVLLF